MLEGDRQASLAVEPAVRNDGDVVVRGNWLEHGHGKCHIVLVFGISLAKDKCVVEQDDLAVDVLNEDPESF